MMRRLIKNLRQRPAEAGFTLAEVVVTVAVVSVTFTAFAVALSTGAIAMSENDQEVVAQGLARSQLEYVKGCAYDTGYAAVAAPSGYAVAVGVTGVPGGGADIQKVTANITRDGELLLAVSDYKVNR